MKVSRHALIVSLAILSLSSLAICPALHAQKTSFHDAPASAVKMKNPYAGKKGAAEAGAKTYASTCAMCHGEKGEGSGNIPSLVTGPTKSATVGELFWFITNGDINNGMPPWEILPEEKRWQIVMFLKSGMLGSAGASENSNSAPGAKKFPI